MRAARTLLGLALTLGLAGKARAGDDLESEARRLYEQGQRAYDHHDWDAAIEAFRAAMELAPSPALHFNIAQAYRLKGDCTRALGSYRRYLDEDLKAPNRDKVEARIAEMRTCARKSEDMPKEALPLATEPRSGAEEPVGAPPNEPDRPWSGRSLRIAGYAGLGTGAGLLLVGYVIGKQAQEREDQISMLFLQGGMWSDEYRALEADGRKTAMVSAVAYAFGAGALVTGGVLVWMGYRRAEAVTVGPLSGGQPGVSMGWKF